MTIAGIVDPATLPRYFVLNENTLCYTIEGHPLGMVGVLARSVIRGGASPMDGPIFIMPSDRTREATLGDFEFYRVSPKGYIA